MTASSLLCVGLGGALGACARYGVADGFARRAARRRDDASGASAAHLPFPWATLIVNTVGAFLLGLLVALVPEPGSPWRLALGTGFAGALTTYSTLGLEVANLLRERSRHGVLYPLVTLALGLLGAVAGIVAGARLG